MVFDSKLVKAVNNTPYYRKLNLKLDRNDVFRFPIITKTTVVNQFKEFKSSISGNTRLLTVSTSGSSGCPLQIIWDQLDYCNSLMEIWRVRKTLGVNPDDRFVSAHVSLDNGNFVITSKAFVQKNNLSLSKIYFDESTLLYYYRLISDFQPKWLLLPPSFLYGFVVFLHEHNLSLPSSIVLAEVTGEYCSAEVYDFLKKAYPNICWRILYGMQEFNVIAYGCENGLKVLDRNVLVEIITDSGEIAKPYQEGNIIITGLKNSVLPLIRYKSEDYGYIDQNGNLHITSARSNDQLLVNNRLYDGSIFWMIIIKLNKYLNCSILQFQVILENDQLLFLLKLNSPKIFDFTQVRSYVEHILTNEFDITYDVNIRIVEQIYPFKNGNKIKYFINKQINN